MKISDDPPLDESWFETGSLDSFTGAVGATYDYCCQDCGASALDRPLFVDATAETANSLEEAWAFYLDSATLTCGECDEAAGEEVGLPSDREALEKLAPATGTGSDDSSNRAGEDSAPQIGPEGASGPTDGATRPGRKDEAPDTFEGVPSSGEQASDGLKESAISPTDPRRDSISEVGGPRGRGKGIGVMAENAPERGGSDEKPISRTVVDEAIRVSGVRDVGIENTFPGRAWRIIYRRAVIGLVAGLLVGVVAAEYAGIPVGAELLNSAVSLGSSAGSSVAIPTAFGGLVGVAYLGHLYARGRRGWPHAPTSTQVNMAEEHRRCRLAGAAAAGVGVVAVGVVVVAGVPFAVAGAVVGIAGGVAALQFRHLHVATVLESGREFPSTALSAGVRFGVLSAALAVAFAPTVAAATGAALFPGVFTLAVGEWLGGVDATSHLSHDE